MANFENGDVLAIGCDHGGYELKNQIIEHLKERGVNVRDFGCFSTDSVDYPEIAVKVTDAIVGGECKLGVLVCGTGIGMSMAANKVKGIRAAACSEQFSARLTRMHNDANVLCLGGRVIGMGTACDMVDLFIDTDFEGGRHTRRVDMIADIENKNA